MAKSSAALISATPSDCGAGELCWEGKGIRAWRRLATRRLVRRSGTMPGATYDR